MATVKRKVKKTVLEGNVYIQATFNNTIITVTDLAGNALSWASAGGLGFRGAKKSTPYAAQTTCETAAKKAMDYGLKTVNVYVKGPGVGRESAIRVLGVLGSRSAPSATSPPSPTTAAAPARPAVSDETEGQGDLSRGQSGKAFVERRN